MKIINFGFWIVDCLFPEIEAETLYPDNNAPAQPVSGLDR